MVLEDFENRPVAKNIRKIQHENKREDILLNNQGEIAQYLINEK
jgi:hypothetical protein